ncbi:MAG: ABC transporter substrate-binding protein [Candidatus Margulisbacteria bacterium]|jgi:sulfonate transport system substrate-binding protein|nr:ABC transporter substrate-binding protein [Candidatus Margulisiibacteriota bacterium]
MLSRFKLFKLGEGLCFAALFALSILVFLNADEGQPKVIRIAAVGNQYGKPYASGVLGVVQTKQLLESEFAKDGIKVEWSVLKGTGPAINEAFANRTVDFTYYGDLPAIVGIAGGLPLKIIAGTGGGQNVYIIAPADSTIKSLEELKGKRVGFLKGTYLQLTFGKIIAARGWTEKDFKVYNLGQADGVAAVAAKSIDAYVAASNGLDQATLGVAKIIYDTRQDPYNWRGSGAFAVTEEFAKKYPDITKRILKQIVIASHWASQPENRKEYLQISAKSGSSITNLTTDLGGDSLKDRNNPLLNTAYRGLIQEGIDFSKANNIIRKAANVNDWIDDSYLNAALRELGLEDYWQ